MHKKFHEIENPILRKATILTVGGFAVLMCVIVGLFAGPILLGLEMAGYLRNAWDGRA